MVIEIILAAATIEMVRAIVWTWQDHKQHNEKSDLLINDLRESKTWGEVFRKTDELHKNRPDLYTPIPEPLSIKIILYFSPELRVQKWKGYKIQ